MKKLILIALLFCCSQAIMGQRLGNQFDNKYDTDDNDNFDPNTNHQGWGVKAGLNFSNVFGFSDINTGNRTGFHVGGLYKKPLLSWFAVQPELLFSRRAFHYVLPNSAERNYVQMDYIDVPVMFYMYPLDNVTLHLGPQGSLLLGLKENRDRISKSGFNTFEFSVAGGIEFKVSVLRIGGRYNLGLRNLLDNSEASQNRIFAKDSGWNEDNFRNASLQFYIAVHINENKKSE